MQAAQSGGVDGIAADCGGSLTCATCHVMVREPWASQLPPPDAVRIEELVKEGVEIADAIEMVAFPDHVRVDEGEPDLLPEDLLEAAE